MHEQSPTLVAHDPLVQDHSVTVSTRPPHGVRDGGFWGAATRLIRASPALTDASERQRAELLSALLLMLTPLGALVAAMLLGLKPKSTFALFGMCVGVLLFSFAYVISRTKHYRLAASLLCVGPIVVACSIGVTVSVDRVWFVIPNVSVILASVLLGARAALATGFAACGSVALALALNRQGLLLSEVVSIVMIDVMLTLLIVVSTWYRNRLEALRERLLRARELELAESRRMESIGRLAGGIAHDFNNLLTVVLANVELLSRGRSVNTAAREIESAGTRAAELTRQLLSYARQQVTTPTIVDVDEIVHNLEPIARRLLPENIRVEWQREPELWRVKMDPTQLEQVVLNLTVNARDAMPDGGVLVIRTANVTRILDGVPQDYAELSLRDTGMGMSGETLERVFEPFFTTKSPGIGTGLGLATVEAIVQQAQGFVEVDSEVHEGTEFRVYLPRSLELRRSVAPPTAEAAPISRPKAAILLVEDDALVRRSVARMLSDTSLQVIEAESVRHAKMLFAAHEGRIEVVLTDVVLTDGSGVELSAYLRERDASLAVLLMTGYADELAQLAHRKENLLVLSKPFTSRDLTSALSRALEQVPESARKTPPNAAVG
jgi:signal transduction histidine kinase/ActR/RegA family two-component response regulator